MLTYAVVIPAYNAAATLERAVLSCVHQTLPPQEIIIVDDASEDETVYIAKGLATQFSNIKICKQEVNQGVSAARNTGWEVADSDYIAFLDSDDEWHLEKMKICMDQCNQHSVSLLWHHYNYLNISKPVNAHLTLLQPTSFTSLIIKSPIATCTIVVKRCTTIRFDESMRYCEDHDFLLRFAYNYAIMEYPESLAIVHRKINSPGGLSGQVWKMRKGEMFMYWKLIRLNFFFIFLIPFLLIFSLLKHIKLLILIKNK